MSLGGLLSEVSEGRFGGRGHTRSAVKWVPQSLAGFLQARFLRPQGLVLGETMSMWLLSSISQSYYLYRYVLRLGKQVGASPLSGRLPSFLYLAMFCWGKPLLIGV